MRAISKLYGNHAIEVLQALNDNTAITLPIILARLKQKDREWRKAKAEMKIYWKQIAEHNHIRSLDHQSFYFKQEDKKRRTVKVLLQELIDLNNIMLYNKADTKHQDKEIDKNIAAKLDNTILNNLQNITGIAEYNYCLRFDLESLEIHQLVYLVLMNAAHYFLTKDQVISIRNFLLYFVHQFLNLKFDHNILYNLEQNNDIDEIDIINNSLALHLKTYISPMKQSPNTSIYKNKNNKSYTTSNNTISSDNDEVKKNLIQDIIKEEDDHEKKDVKDDHKKKR